MRTIGLHQVDSFTNQLFGGNPAGVVTDADALTDIEMGQIAREMNLSETAFVLKPISEEADVRLRFFTPEGIEITFCGHATVGALFQLARLGARGFGKSGTNHVRIETGAGILPMSILNHRHSLPQITFTAPEVALEPYRLQGVQFAEEFGVAINCVDSHAEILRDAVLNYVYIPVSSLTGLTAQQFDFTHIRKRFGKEGVVVFCFYSAQTIDKASDLHARGLAPNVGVDEDPFTGSMQAGLVCAAKHNDYLDAAQKHIITEQGHLIGRPGFARVEHDIKNEIVRVTASAVPVFSTHMEVR
jgi:trans-2,3-dihydro-3-hydroxyanthranilate isomerase